MHFATILKITAASTLLVAASAQGATVTWDGGGTTNDWNDRFNWNPNAVPTLADDAVIPTGFNPHVTSTLSSTDAVANSLDVQGTAQIVILDNTLQVDGGGNSTIDSVSPPAILLDDIGATLYLSAGQTFSGDGVIELNDTGALIEIASGATITMGVTVHGFGSISAASGTATMVNNNAVLADDVNGNPLELASDLILSDSAGTLWKAQGSGVLQFKRQQTSGSGGVLLGDVFSVSGGNLHFYESVTFNDAGACPGGSLFTWGTSGTTSTLTIEPNKTFTYKCFSSPSCSNPGTGSSPYSVTAGGSQYSQTCSPP